MGRLRLQLPILQLLHVIVLFSIDSSSEVESFQLSLSAHSPLLCEHRRRLRSDGFDTKLFSEITETCQVTAQTGALQTRRPCFFKSASGKWKERIELGDLKLGQELTDCHVVQELLDAKTGPKLFCDCGVGRTRDGQQWKIVTGVLRLDQDRRKLSVARKRAARLKGRPAFSGFVSRIRPDSDQFEICLSIEEVQSKQRPKLPGVSSLSAGQEVIGTVVRIENYGVLVNVGVNRPGLLHIKTVADLVGKFLPPTVEGFEGVGLELGAKVKLQVQSNEKKRLFLDFTEDVKQEAEQEREDRKRKKEQQAKQAIEGDSGVQVDVDGPSSDAITDLLPVLSKEEEAAWAAYASQSESAQVQDEEESDDDDDEYDDDDYDEDRDIEDALGLGTY